MKSMVRSVLALMIFAGASHLAQAGESNDEFSLWKEAEARLKSLRSEEKKLKGDIKAIENKANEVGDDSTPGKAKQLQAYGRLVKADLDKLNVVNDKIAWLETLQSRARIKADPKVKKVKQVDNFYVIEAIEQARKDQDEVRNPKIAYPLRPDRKNVKDELESFEELAKTAYYKSYADLEYELFMAPIQAEFERAYAELEDLRQSLGLGAMAVQSDKSKGFTNSEPARAHGPDRRPAIEVRAADK